MARYGLGVDTGGTFTDSVIMDLDNHTVISKAKARTTHHDLSVGLYESVDKVFSGCSIRPSEIAMAGISTTLATNSVLEGQGGNVGLIIIGWDPKKSVSFGEKNQVFVSGGYDIKGHELQHLNLEEVRSAIKKVSEGVDAIAISGLFSVVNPRQENTVRDLCIEMTGLPTVAGTELSSSLGVDERARTAVLNGKLLPIVKKFFDGLESTFRKKGISAPIMVYRGDGSVMSIDKARRYPVESVFSGPAASSVGGRITSGYNDFIMIDIGGTSTDVALVENGMPEIQAEGAMVHNWRTHVKAVDMYTVALGGDSLIRLQDSKIELSDGTSIPFFSLSRYKSFNFNIGPERVIPLSVFSAEHPSVIGLIENSGICEYYLLIDEPAETDERTGRVISAMRGKGPLSMLDIRDNTHGLWAIDDEIRFLVDNGYALHTGLTPSDLLVYRGCFDNGDRRGSEAGVRAMAEILRMKDDAVVERLLDMVHTKIAEAIMSRLLDDRIKDWRSDGAVKFMRELVSKKRPKGFTLMPRIDIPIIGIGAPTKHIMGDVGERLGAELIFPENGDVGNAIGAVCSKMVESMESTITPTAENQFRVMVPFLEYSDHMHLNDAVDYAQRKMKEFLTERLVADGAKNIEVKFKLKIYSMSDDGAWTQNEIDHAVVTAKAIGDPPLM